MAYLADASIWAWAEKDPRSDLAERLSLRIAWGHVATCPVVLLELMHRARNGVEYETLRRRLARQGVQPCLLRFHGRADVARVDARPRRRLVPLPCCVQNAAASIRFNAKRNGEG